MNTYPFLGLNFVPIFWTWLAMRGGHFAFIAFQDCHVAPGVRLFAGSINSLILSHRRRPQPYLKKSSFCILDPVIVIHTLFLNHVDADFCMVGLSDRHMQKWKDYQSNAAEASKELSMVKSNNILKWVMLYTVFLSHKYLAMLTW